MLKMTNQMFCYWLQGYFEISRNCCFTKNIVLKIKKKLEQIQEPLGVYTQWLLDTLTFLTKQNYKQGFLDLFFPVIQSKLNLVFFHVIDNSYERTVNLAEARKIHKGIFDEQRRI
jgi:hypothetical protein